MPQAHKDTPISRTFEEPGDHLLVAEGKARPHLVKVNPLLHNHQRVSM